nr:MAG TPA: hypothetical protein [Caudoviricetes sp.]
MGGIIKHLKPDGNPVMQNFFNFFFRVAEFR